MNNIAIFRRAAGVSQTELAQRCGWVSQARIGNYENGKRHPSLKDCRKIVSALNALGAKCTLDTVFPPECDDA
ncbi:helix-turn-helix transcriptional regulator [Mixta calida]|uniref:helix-turn-helix transcriptional regulator n=1 Tax=Mixta calida TaxID=665913 RepID=UPI0034D45C43